MKLNQLTITQASQGLKARKYSCHELVQACLDRIQSVDGKIKAFITVCRKESLEQAKKMDELAKNNANIFAEKPLLGIPVAVKDLYCTKGIRTTAGSKVLENYVPVFDATAIKKIKDAGGIIIGKTNLDAWGHGSSGENSDFFSTHNPWKLNKTPGGSSSGSAASLAADMCLASTGNDTGGSIRCPASFCNLVGLKPTYGRVSRYGVIAMASSLDSIGHFTKTVEDSAQVLSVTAGDDKKDATTPQNPVPDYLKELKKPLKKIRIGLPKEYFIKGVDSKVKKIIEKAIGIFKERKFAIKKVSLPHTQYAIAVYYLVQPSEVSSNLARYDGIRYGQQRSAFGDEAKRRIMLGTHALSSGYYDAYYLKAMKVRTLIKKDFDKAFESVDLLLTPVMPTPPFNLGEKTTAPLTMYLTDILTAPVNLAGLPALALPCGFTQDNLPVGMQLIAPQFSESLLFQIGHFYQQITDHHTKKPKIVDR